MSLPLYHQHPSLLPNAIPDRIFESTPVPKILIRRNNVRTKFVIRSSTSEAKTLPQSAIQRIAEKLRSLGFTEENPNSHTRRISEAEPVNNSPGEIFVPLPSQIPIHRVGHTIDTSWSTPSYPVPKPGSGTAISRYHELRKEWKEEKKLERKKEEKVPTLAELTLPPAELRMLTALGIRLTKKLKIGKAGITEGIVNGIHERWRTSEVVKIVCEDISRMNMKRTHDVLERKTGGLVVWRSGSKILLYRGVNYQYPYFISDQSLAHGSSMETASGESSGDVGAVDRRERINNAESSGSGTNSKTVRPALIQGVGSPNKVRFQLPGEAKLVEEADRLLDGLGPRFTDWWAYDPLPVDADLLPAVVPGYRRPFRLLPFGVNPKLTDDEMTTLRRLGRPLPCHFALGRNRKLQGLAVAIVKLWEKCEIAKVAVKRGVQNTNSEMMAEELKWLTGATLLSRDKDFIVLYRGKDFLPSAVSSAVEERRKRAVFVEKPSAKSDMPPEKEEGIKPQVTGENDAGREAGNAKDHISARGSRPKQLKSPEAALERTSIMLSMALEKKAKAEKVLAELESKEIPQHSVDKEGITEDEKYMLRKVGLRMKPFLLLGRRGVFDGTIENMHLHWKYRELVKIICKERSIEAAQHVAEVLEAESGGILVAVERVSKGYAIIVYRGKNYQRPASLRPQTLLTKREALKRSIEAQRQKSLKLHVLKLSKSIEDLNRRLVKDQTNAMQPDEEAKNRMVQEEAENHLTEFMESRDEMELGYSSDQSIPCSKEDGSNHEAETSTTNTDNGMDVTTNYLPLHQDEEAGSSSSQRDDSICQDMTANISLRAQRDFLKTSSRYNNLMPSSSTSLTAEQSSPGRKKLEKSSPEPQISDPVDSETEANWLTSGPTDLSNRERLILRKQALKMKKRPPFAVGRSNVVTGIAKALRTHFEKNPLAIVNVKGRAKGTSVQEVVSKLKEATGAMLVSQEPSKVILYRGWGAEDTGSSSCFYPNNNIKGRSRSVISSRKRRGVDPLLPVSPQLIEAIRLECGLLDHRP
ncbi:PREDICTED: CRM-domain containing factor CFM2, chloroplastic [Tarenaya hassleriana]|uniref:CRM-domain containing factor CFM2, chloroplastic n=1 Tax=Tarenaya hassleriana TaxID=28532 RepID=UPI00053CA037|nr:PREDICTED: CRM-domain containing factor CFM2, chloroplastic [Tarenaya hassleriana]